MDDIFLQAEEAEEILESRLTEEDFERVKEIYRDVNKEIRWGALIDEAFPVLLDMLDQVFENAVPSMCKHQDPWYKVLDSDLALLDEEEPKFMPRKHLLLLWLVKKLLGGLKTRVNQSVAEVPILSADEETELLEVIDQVDELGREFAAEEETLEFEENEVGSKQSEVVATIDIAPEGDCRQNGRHVRTTVRWKRLNGEMFSETYCKDCRTVLRKIQSKVDRPDPEECEHPGAEWAEGKEGQEALCTKCKGVIPNPETYRWIEAGLEPYADDPAKDEVITLCTDY